MKKYLIIHLLLLFILFFTVLCENDNLKDQTQNNNWAGPWQDHDAKERNGNVKLTNTAIISDYTKPMVGKLITARELGDGGELMAPYSILFRLKQ